VGDSERLPRKLAAILCVEVAEYSRLTGEDENATHRRLSEYLDRISSTVDWHRGRVMHYAGDAALVMFGAQPSAAEVRNEWKVCNDRLVDNRRIEFRFGVNVGGVIED